MPATVEIPKPGKLVFIPPMQKPPQARYDFTGKPPVRSYPKFVVFEAKHIAKTFSENDIEGIKKEARKRLGNTCDGAQMGLIWTEKRIPQALERQYSGARNRPLRVEKLDAIRDDRYARWIFVCLPGPIGSNTKLYVLIDVIASDMDLESKVPKLRKISTPSDSIY